MAKKKSKKSEDEMGLQEQIIEKFEDTVIDPVTEFAENVRLDSKWMWLAGGAVLGFAAAFLFDPAQGRHRRALIRDKGMSYTNKAMKYGGKVGRDMGNRSKGLMHRGGSKDDTTETVS